MFPACVIIFLQQQLLVYRYISSMRSARDNKPRPPQRRSVNHWSSDMEAMKKAASGAVEKVRNSPLFRRKFGTPRSNSPLSDEEQASASRQQELHPERDLTPFVQGVYFNVS